MHLWNVQEHRGKCFSACKLQVALGFLSPVSNATATRRCTRRCNIRVQVRCLSHLFCLPSFFSVSFSFFLYLFLCACRGQPSESFAKGEGNEGSVVLHLNYIFYLLLFISTHWQRNAPEILTLCMRVFSRCSCCSFCNRSSERKYKGEKLLAEMRPRCGKHLLHFQHFACQNSVATRKRRQQRGA